jgi:hypothetical protein
MTSPYSLPEQDTEKRAGPRFTLLTLIGAIFIVFMIINTAITIGNTQDELQARALEPGDRIEYHITVTSADGTLLETTELATAERAARSGGFTVGDADRYGPRQATIDPTNPGLGWGQEVEAAVAASHAGATVRTLTTHGDDWTPFPSPEGLPRTLDPQPFQRQVFLQEPEAAAEEGRTGTQNFDLDALEQEIGPIEPGMSFNPAPQRAFWPSWDIVFDDINRDNRSLLYHETVQDGDYHDIQGIPGGITIHLNEDETQLWFTVDLEEGVFTVEPGHPLTQDGFRPGSYRIHEVTQDRVHMDHNDSFDPELVGQGVTVEIRILRKL